MVGISISAVSEASLDTGGTPLEAIDETETTSFRLVLIEDNPNPSTKRLQWHKAQLKNKMEIDNFAMFQKVTESDIDNFRSKVEVFSLPHVELLREDREDRSWCVSWLGNPFYYSGHFANGITHTALMLSYRAQPSIIFLFYY